MGVCVRVCACVCLCVCVCVGRGYLREWCVRACACVAVRVKGFRCVQAHRCSDRPSRGSTPEYSKYLLGKPLVK